MKEGGEISVATFGTNNAGTVAVTAGALSVASGGAILADAEAGSGGNAGGVTVTAGSLTVIDNGEISSSAGGPNPSTGAPASTGNAGDVTVDVTGTGAGALTIRTNGSISANTSAAGDAGKVFVDVAGGLTINGEGANPRYLTGIAAQANRGSTGAGGDVRVRAGALSIAKNGEIASSTFGAGKGGNVSVKVAGRLTINGNGANPRYLTGISSQANQGSKGSAGDVAVTAGTLVIVDGGAVQDATFGAGNAGSVDVTAGVLRVANGGAISSDSEAGSSGIAGNVTIQAGRLEIVDGLISIGLLAAYRGAPASTGKRAGTVTVTVSGLLQIVGSGSKFLRGIATDANPGTIGNAGNVRVSAGALSIADNGEIGSGTFGAGKGGRIAVDVAGGLTIDGAGSNPGYVTGIAAQANPGSTNNAGDVLVRAGSLAILDDGSISSSAIGPRGTSPAATGSAGTVTVTVAGLLTIEGSGSEIATTTDPGTTGNAGSVEVRAGQISIADGGALLSTTAGTGAGGSVVVTTPGALVLDGGDVPGTEIAASATGTQSGAAGTVTVSAGGLTIDGRAQIASTTAGTGIGGNVSVSVTSDLVLSGPGPQITALSTGGGDAGSIAVSADQLLITGGAAISTTAETATANGGNISLSLRAQLFLTDGEITTSVQGKTGNGGNITLSAPFVILDHSDVIAQAIAGHGGDIMIDAGQYIPSSDSTVSASSALGVSGNVVISGPRVDLNGTLVVLSSELRNPVALTRDSCAAREPRPQSSLAEAGRGGLPEDPNATLPALYLAGRDLRLGPPSAVLRADRSGDLPADLGSQPHCG